MHEDETASLKRGKPAAPPATGADVPQMGSIIGYKLRRAQVAVFQDFIGSCQRMQLRLREQERLAAPHVVLGDHFRSAAVDLGERRLTAKRVAEPTRMKDEEPVVAEVQSDAVGQLEGSPPAASAGRSTSIEGRRCRFNVPPRPHGALLRGRGYLSFIDA